MGNEKSPDSSEEQGAWVVEGAHAAELREPVVPRQSKQVMWNMQPVPPRDQPLPVADVAEVLFPADGNEDLINVDVEDPDYQSTNVSGESGEDHCLPPNFVNPVGVPGLGQADDGSDEIFPVPSGFGATGSLIGIDPSGPASMAQLRRPSDRQPPGSTAAGPAFVQPIYNPTKESPRTAQPATHTAAMPASRPGIAPRGHTVAIEGLLPGGATAAFPSVRIHDPEADDGYSATPLLGAQVIGYETTGEGGAADAADLTIQRPGTLKSGPSIMRMPQIPLAVTREQLYMAERRLETDLGASHKKAIVGAVTMQLNGQIDLLRMANEIRIRTRQLLLIALGQAVRKALSDRENKSLTAIEVQMLFNELEKRFDQHPWQHPSVHSWSQQVLPILQTASMSTLVELYELNADGGEPGVTGLVGGHIIVQEWAPLAPRVCITYTPEAENHVKNSPHPREVENSVEYGIILGNALDMATAVGAEVLSKAQYHAMHTMAERNGHELDKQTVSFVKPPQTMEQPTHLTIKPSAKSDPTSTVWVGGRLDMQNFLKKPPDHHSLTTGVRYRKVI